MTHKPTEEQQAIIDAARTTNDNLIVSALAGAAKTSTLVMLAEALTPTTMLCLAFNKKIAEEMKTRLPANCTALTLNSLGHRAWMEACSARVTLDTKKNFNNLSALVSELPKAEKEYAGENFSDILSAIDSGKAAGYIPTGHYKQVKPLVGDDDFFGGLDDDIGRIGEKLVREATLKSIEQSMKGLIDFGDQIFMPTLFPAMFPTFPVVMIDEAQDLSALNHRLLAKLVRNRRLIAVGDPNQAIYGFRGADEASMPTMQQRFDMKPYTLSISFRCPQAVVKEARWRTPNMQYPEWAKVGEVKTLTEWSVTDVPQNAAIICRNNAPLFSMAIKLLKNGRYPQIIGNDIGKYLVKTMKKFGNSSMKRDEVLIAITKWADEKKKKTRSPDKVEDQAVCLRVFAEQGEDLGGAIAYAEHIFASQGPTLLMTGHKSKGLEYDDVFILDRHLLRLEPGSQDNNLLYVMQTRAKETLTYVSTENFTEN